MSGPCYLGSIRRPKCQVCNGTEDVRRVGKWLIGHDMALCYHCLTAWYDEGARDTEQMREKSLKSQKRFEELYPTYQI